MATAIILMVYTFHTYKHLPMNKSIRWSRRFKDMPKKTKKKTPLSPIQTLINSRPDIWQGVHAGKHNALRVQSSYYPKFDAILPKNGWPLDHLSEIYYPVPGIGELQLLMPALEALQQRYPHLTPAFINPPHLPYPPGLFSMPFILHIKTDQYLWSLEECLLSRACLAVVAWLKKPPSDTQLRRIQLAARQTGTWCVLMYCTQKIPQRSPASLRIEIKPIQIQTYEQHQQSVQLSLIKKPFGWAGQTIELKLTDRQPAAPHMNGQTNSQETLLPQPLLPSTVPSTLSDISQPSMLLKKPRAFRDDGC